MAEAYVKIEKTITLVVNDVEAKHLRGLIAKVLPSDPAYEIGRVLSNVGITYGERVPYIVRDPDTLIPVK